MNANWDRLSPEFVSPSDLSPLSLEAHAMNSDGSFAVDHIFRIEEPQRIVDWVSNKTGKPVQLPRTNASDARSNPTIGTEALNKIRIMMPLESEMYAL